MMCALRDDWPKTFSKLKWVGNNRRHDRDRKQTGVIIAEVAISNKNGDANFFCRGMNPRTIDRVW